MKLKTSAWFVIGSAMSSAPKIIFVSQEISEEERTQQVGKAPNIIIKIKCIVNKKVFSN